MADAHLERLLAELGERARTEIAQVEADAAVRAAAIRDEACTRAAAHTAEALSALEAELAHRRGTELAEARRRARGALLTAQHALVGRVLDRARALAIARLAAPESKCGLDRRAAVLGSYAVGADAVIERLESGLRLTADSGHLSVDDTVDAWLESDRAAIAIELCRAVEGEGEAA
jgi:hypothetical protein